MGVGEPASTQNMVDVRVPTPADGVVDGVKNSRSRTSAAPESIAEIRLGGALGVSVVKKLSSVSVRSSCRELTAVGAVVHVGGGEVAPPPLCAKPVADSASTAPHAVIPFQNFIRCLLVLGKLRSNAKLAIIYTRFTFQRTLRCL